MTAITLSINLSLKSGCKNAVFAMAFTFPLVSALEMSECSSVNGNVLGWFGSTILCDNVNN